MLVAGSIASLAANVAVAEPTLVGRVIAAWPSFALTASYAAHPGRSLSYELRTKSAAHVFLCKVTGNQDSDCPVGDLIEGTELVRVERKRIVDMIATSDVMEMQTVAAVLLAELKASRVD